MGIACVEIVPTTTTTTQDLGPYGIGPCFTETAHKHTATENPNYVPTEWGKTGALVTCAGFQAQNGWCAYSQYYQDEDFTPRIDCCVCQEWCSRMRCYGYPETNGFP